MNWGKKGAKNCKKIFKKGLNLCPIEILNFNFFLLNFNITFASPLKETPG